jgi:hypothetical protein
VREIPAEEQDRIVQIATSDEDPWSGGRRCAA